MKVASVVWVIFYGLGLDGSYIGLCIWEAPSRECLRFFVL